MKIKPVYLLVGAVALIAIAAASGGKKKKDEAIDLNAALQRLKSAPQPATPVDMAVVNAAIAKLSSPFKAIGRVFDKWLKRGDEQRLAEWYEWKYAELFHQFKDDIDSYAGGDDIVDGGK